MAGQKESPAEKVSKDTPLRDKRFSDPLKGVNEKERRKMKKWMETHKA